MARLVLWPLAILALLLCGPLLSVAFGRASLAGDWRHATQRSTGLAPDPSGHPEAIVPVYASRTVGWRGAYSDHTWLAAKPAGAQRFTRYEVIGWNGGAGRSVISVSDGRAADAEWFGAVPRLLRDVRGSEATAIIAKLPGAVASYPYGTTYHAWPGPNSNTFVAHLGREIPELRMTMPSTAIGKDFLPVDRMVTATPSGTGTQFSLLGVLGVLYGTDEGIELNVLGLVTGIDIRHPAVKLPGLGRVPGNG